MILVGSVSATSVNTSKVSSTSHTTAVVSSSYASYNNTTNIPSNGNYPSSYDLRNYGKLTPVENQGNTGDCWAFGSLGSLESNLLPYENDSFSENNMKNVLNNYSPVGFDFSDGGTYDMALAYLAGWEGPVYTYQDPYDDSSSYTSGELMSPVKHVQDALMLPSRTAPLDNNYIKWALMNYGAVATYMYMNESTKYFNPSTNAYYFNGNSAIDHGVDIVGWDDSYSKTNFDITPPGNGAFIIRNSWGSDWGDNGYFYVSYYDTVLGIGTATGGSHSPNFVFLDAQNTSNYNKNYQYDTYGWVSSRWCGSNTAWFSNIFNSTGNDLLSAASFYVYSPGSTYNLYVYANSTKNNPVSGKLVSSLTGTLMSGYWTINLASPVNLWTGELFSVVVKLTTPGCNSPIPIQSALDGYSSSATFKPGQSFISSNGSTWTDAYNYGETVCLKAFTTPNILQPTKLVLNSINGVKGDVVSLTATLTSGNLPLKGYTITFYLNGVPINNPNNPAVTDINGMAILYYTITSNPGIYQLLAMFNVSPGYNSSNATSKLTVMDNTPPTVTINQNGGFYNMSQTIYLTATDPDSSSVTYYTLDGSNPQTSSTRIVYDGTAIIIKNSTTLLYSAVDPSNNWSPIYKQTYIIDTTPPTAYTNIPGGLYKTNQTVSITMNKEGTIYYTWNGSTPTKTSAVYTSPLSINSNITIKYLAVDLYGNTSPVYSVTYTIDMTPPVPVASVNGGSYNTTKVVTLSMKEGGTIYYTLDGTTPTTSSTVYSGPITISSNKVLKYLAVDHIGNISPIYTQTYTIDKTAPKVVSTSPSNNAKGVSLITPLTIKFNEKIGASTNFSRIYIKNLTTGKIVKSTVTSISGNTLTLKMTVHRLGLNNYQVYIPSGAIRDAAGNKGSKYVFNFKTKRS